MRIFNKFDDLPKPVQKGILFTAGAGAGLLADKAMDTSQVKFSKDPAQVQMPEKLINNIVWRDGSKPISAEHFLDAFPAILDFVKKYPAKNFSGIKEDVQRLASGEVKGLQLKVNDNTCTATLLYKHKGKTFKLNLGTYRFVNNEGSKKSTRELNCDSPLFALKGLKVNGGNFGADFDHLNRQGLSVIRTAFVDSCKQSA